MCSWLVINNYVDGCLSEDTDLFVYGCNKVYKKLDLNNESITEYDLNSILIILNIPTNSFIQICVISDNDYNDNNKGFIYYYNLYKKYIKTNNNNCGDFYHWLSCKGYDIDYDNLIKISNKFKVSKVFDIDIDIKNKNKNINKNELINFLKKYNFIFI